MIWRSKPLTLIFLIVVIVNSGYGSDSATKGTAIVAVRTSSVAGLGHVGVAFQNADGTWTAGAIEGAPDKTWSNLGGAVVFSSGKNGGWSDKFNTREDVEKEFLRREYNQIKIIPVENSNPELANKKIQSFENAGYFAPFNDCLTQTDAVLKEYGVKNNKNLQFEVGTTLTGTIGSAAQLASDVIPNIYFYSLPGTEKSLTQKRADQESSSRQSQDAPVDQSFGEKSDLGGINFTSIKLTFIAVSTDQDGGVNFDLILKAQRAEGTSPGIDPINSTLIGATAFLTGLAVPDNKFWVNLNPWEEDRIIDDQLKQSDVGRIMLEADFQMKKDFSNYGNPCTNETGKALHKLLDVRHDTLVQQCMKKFPGEVKDIDNIQFEPVTRHWIIPDKIYAYTNGTRIYLINATLAINSEPVANHSSFRVVNQDIRTLSKGCLEELNRSAKEYGEYFRELEDRMTHPYVVADVNRGAKYENLRNVYVALALAQWYKSRVSLHIDIFRDRLNSPNSTVLASQRSWNPNEIWNDYVYSFKNGEYKCWDNTTTKTAKGAYTESSYYSAGGVDFYGIKKHLVEINSLPPEVQYQVDKAIQDGIVDEEEYLLFGNRLHAYMKQDDPASISDSGTSPKPPEPFGLKQGVHGHSNENKTDNTKVLYDEKLSGENNAHSPVAKSTAKATQIICPKGWSGPDKNGECWISIPLGSKGH